MANEKILVVDDDANICELLRLYLTKEGYQVTTAGDGEEGLEKFNHKDLFVCHKGFLPSGLSNGRRACGRPCVKKALHLLLYWRVMTK